MYVLVFVLGFMIQRMMIGDLVEGEGFGGVDICSTHIPGKIHYDNKFNDCMNSPITQGKTTLCTQQSIPKGCTSKEGIKGTGNYGAA